MPIYLALKKPYSLPMRKGFLTLFVILGLVLLPGCSNSEDKACEITRQTAEKYLTEFTQTRWQAEQTFASWPEIKSASELFGGVWRSPQEGKGYKSAYHAGLLTGTIITAEKYIKTLETFPQCFEPSQVAEARMVINRALGLEENRF